jgi:hypothetical protein
MRQPACLFRFTVIPGVALLLIAAPSGWAHADNLLGLYVGGAVGEARVDATAPVSGDFNEHHTAFKVMVGARPLSWAGVELAYQDFGDPSRSSLYLASDVKMKGEAAFGVFYLPVPVVDVFLKAGLARLDSTATTQVVCPVGYPCTLIVPPPPENRTNTGFAGGVGTQFKIGSFAIRGEYERFNAAGGNPSLLSLGLTWSF